jgi:hypothetical protein
MSLEYTTLHTAPQTTSSQNFRLFMEPDENNDRNYLAFNDNSYNYNNFNLPNTQPFSQANRFISPNNDISQSASSRSTVTISSAQQNHVDLFAASSSRRRDIINLSESTYVEYHAKYTETGKPEKSLLKNVPDKNSPKFKSWRRKLISMVGSSMMIKK